MESSAIGKTTIKTHYMERTWNCGTTAFLGSVRISIKWSVSKLCNATLIGTRPTNSGINPKLTRSL